MCCHTANLLAQTPDEKKTQLAALVPIIPEVYQQCAPNYYYITQENRLVYRSPRRSIAGGLP